jgi:hypothetical protein
MKNYNQFLNERTIQLLKNYKLVPEEFAINVKNCTDFEKKEIVSQISKYLDIDDDDMEELTDNQRYEIPWAWVFKIDNWNQINISFVTTPNWGAGVDYMSDIITGKEFLEVGLEGVKDLVLLKKEERLMKINVKKYNL